MTPTLLAAVRRMETALIALDGPRGTLVSGEAYSAAGYLAGVFELDEWRHSMGFPILAPASAENVPKE